MPRRPDPSLRWSSSPQPLALLLALALSSTSAGCGDDDAPITPAVDAGADLSVVRCAADLDCSDALFCNGRERCAPSAPTADARGCVAGPPACGTDTCDEAGATCPLGCVDVDGDGVTSADCGGEDCDDADASRFPGNPELCDAVGLDDDCNPSTLGADGDGDLFVSTACCNALPGGLSCGFDCDDTQSGVNPGSPEACNGVDDDCDALIDENADGSSMRIDCYADADGDGFPSGAVLAVSSCACGAGLTATPPTSVDTLDCDDADSARHPGAAEVCNFADDDCDAMADDGVPRPTGTLRTRPEAFRMRMSGSAMVNLATPREAWLTYEIRANDRGAAWVETPLYLGYGVLRVVARARAIASGDAPTGGWSVVLARGTPAGTDLGAAGDALGVPADRIGLAIEWHFAGNGADTITVLRIGPFGNTVLAGPVAVDSAMHLSGADTSSVTQRLQIDYTPEDLITLAREERLVVRTVGGVTATVVDITPADSFLGYELSAAEPIQIGFTAASGPTGATRVYVAADDSSDETYIERTAICPPP